jgi:hypothetical protein
MDPKEELKQVFANFRPVEVAITVSGFTGHRTTLIDELTETEAVELLKVYRPSHRKIDQEFDALKEDLIKREWKSKVLAKAEKVGVKKQNSFADFNNWMFLKSKFKKHLNAHSIEELKELHRQLCAFQTNKAKSAAQYFTKAWWEKEAQNVKLN